MGAEIQETLRVAAADHEAERGHLAFLVDEPFFEQEGSGLIEATLMGLDLSAAIEGKNIFVETVQDEVFERGLGHGP